MAGVSNRETAARRAFTLLELLAVVAIVATVALIAVSRIGGLTERARTVAAERDLAEIRDAFVNPETGYLRDLRGIPGFSPCCLRIANLLVSTNLYGATADAAGRLRALRVDDVWQPGAARPQEFTVWNAQRERGWRGPYLRHRGSAFPARDDVRFPEDVPFGERGFFPPLADPGLPADFRTGRNGCSIYGFPGEDAVPDPWGNPYVLQVPPPQAFPGAGTNIADDVRFHYARVVSAGPDGRLDTPCHAPVAAGWNERTRRLVRQAGRIDTGDLTARGDDLVLFLYRNDIDEGEEGR